MTNLLCLIVKVFVSYSITFDTPKNKLNTVATKQNDKISLKRSCKTSIYANAEFSVLSGHHALITYNLTNSFS